MKRMMMTLVCSLAGFVAISQKITPGLTAHLAPAAQEEVSMHLQRANRQLAVGAASVCAGAALLFAGFRMPHTAMATNSWGQPQYEDNKAAEAVKLAGALLAIFGVRNLVISHRYRQMARAVVFAGDGVAGVYPGAGLYAGLGIAIPIGHREH